MSQVFADSFYFFALTNIRDESHARVVEWTNSLVGRMVTTEWVMLEFADGVAGSPGRKIFHSLRQEILDNHRHQVIPLDMKLYQDGMDLFCNRPDKLWSLTDCISFIVMRREGLTDALTGDHHFQQAGFTAVFG